MIIKRKSVYSGLVRSKDIPLDPQDWALFQSGYASIMDAMPYLSDVDRDFILSGIVEGEWDEAFKEESSDAL
jgi:hypothetical protein